MAEAYQAGWKYSQGQLPWFLFAPSHVAPIPPAAALAVQCAQVTSTLDVSWLGPWTGFTPGRHQPMDAAEIPQQAGLGFDGLRCSHFNFYMGFPEITFRKLSNFLSCHPASGNEKADIHTHGTVGCECYSMPYHSDGCGPGEHRTRRLCTGNFLVAWHNPLYISHSGPGKMALAKPGNGIGLVA